MYGCRTFTFTISILLGMLTAYPRSSWYSVGRIIHVLGLRAVFVDINTSDAAIYFPSRPHFLHRLYCQEHRRNQQSYRLGWARASSQYQFLLGVPTLTCHRPFTYRSLLPARAKPTIPSTAAFSACRVAAIDSRLHADILDRVPRYWLPPKPDQRRF